MHRTFKLLALLVFPAVSAIAQTDVAPAPVAPLTLNQSFNATAYVDDLLSNLPSATLVSDFSSTSGMTLRDGRPVAAPEVFLNASCSGGEPFRSQQSVLNPGGATNFTDGLLDGLLRMAFGTDKILIAKWKSR